MTALARVGASLHWVFARRTLREVHFAYATFTSRDAAAVLRGLLRTPFEGGAQAEARFSAEFGRFLGVEEAFGFSAGRTAWMAILKALDIGPGDEVALPAFTCVVVPAAVKAVGATPVYVDIDPATFNYSSPQLEAQVGPRCRAILAQHIFGLPAPIDDIQAVARRYKAFVVEDCAHVLGGRAGGRTLGTIGDAAFFSMELTKPLNVGWGGFAVSRHASIRDRLRAVHADSAAVPRLRDLQAAFQLLAAWRLYDPWWYWVGRPLLGALYLSGVFRQSIPPMERTLPEVTGQRPMTRLSPVQALAALSQLARVHDDNGRRSRLGREFTELFRDAGWPVVRAAERTPCLRYPFVVADRDRALEVFRGHGVELGQWFNAPLHPMTSNAEAFDYTAGSCPEAERLSKHVVNLPLHPKLTPRDIVKIRQALHELLRLEPQPPSWWSAAMADQAENPFTSDYENAESSDDMRLTRVP